MDTEEERYAAHWFVFGEDDGPYLIVIENIDSDVQRILSNAVSEELGYQGWQTLCRALVEACGEIRSFHDES